MSNKCAICQNEQITEESPILAIGAYGAKKCLCDECARLVDTATEGTDYDAIAEAMARLSEKMAQGDVDDPLTVRTMAELMSAAGERARAIKDGTYDPEADAEEELLEVPEELLESEEDRLLDEREAESNKRFDRIMNWVTLGVVAAAVIFFIWWFFLK